VFSILIDAPVGRGVTADVARFRSTRAFPLIRDSRGEQGFALRPGPAFDFEDDMVLATGKPGLTFEVLPPDYRLAGIIDAYIYLAN
jgi:hypothetical protein